MDVGGEGKAYESYWVHPGGGPEVTGGEQRGQKT